MSFPPDTCSSSFQFDGNTVRESTYATCETDIADQCVLDRIFDQLRRKMQDLEDVLGKAGGFEGVRDAFRSKLSYN